MENLLNNLIFDNFLLSSVSVYGRINKKSMKIKTDCLYVWKIKIRFRKLLNNYTNLKNKIHIRLPGWQGSWEFYFETVKNLKWKKINLKIPQTINNIVHVKNCTTYFKGN